MRKGLFYIYRYQLRFLVGVSLFIAGLAQHGAIFSHLFSYIVSRLNQLIL